MSHARKGSPSGAIPSFRTLPPANNLSDSSFTFSVHIIVACSDARHMLTLHE